MEIDARRQLIEELDRSLLDHTAALGQKEGGPTIGDAYELQGMAERHYYLKVEHEFTAAEVEALLSFADPLAVAAACWEENDHQHSFPICELLNEIGAYQRFPMKEDVNTQSQEQLVEAVKAVLDQEMLEYRTSLLSKGKTELIEKSCEIAAMKNAHTFMMSDYEFEKGDAETLLRMEKPLRFVASLWPTGIDPPFDMSDLISESIGTAGAYQQEDKPAIQESARPGKPSLQGQLRAAMQEVKQRPTHEGTAKTGDAR